MASSALQGALRTASSLAKTAVRPTATLNKKFDHPFTYEEAGPSNPVGNRFSTHSAASASQTTTPASDAVNTKSTFTTVADHGHLNSKFRVPFDENPLQMQEDFIEQVEAIPFDVQKERGYHIIGKVKATSQDSLQKLLALGDMRIYQ
jgi:hypothetical protein